MVPITVDCCPNAANDPSATMSSRGFTGVTPYIHILTSSRCTSEGPGSSLALEGNMLKANRLRAAGFSLIELLVVVAIIMIIMGMAIPRIQVAKKLAFEAAAMKAISTIHVAQAQYQ